MFVGKKIPQIREILTSESAWEEMTCIRTFLENNHQDHTLKSILNLDLSFIDYRAQSSNYFIINDVEYIGDNNYILYYKINYYIYNLCKDMDIDDDYETSINFTLNNGLLVFDIIDCERNTSDEL
ncbi:hypothetical protein [Citrobacter freundii]|uniref:hypothetical protein n=1 Tax=Citrobacter freundii TaxID=546 RepID=UPI00339C1861